MSERVAFAPVLENLTTLVRVASIKRRRRLTGKVKATGDYRVWFQTYPPKDRGPKEWHLPTAVVAATTQAVILRNAKEALS